MLRAFSPRFLRFLLPPTFLLALTFALFWDVLGGGRRLYWGDIGLYFVPLLSLQRETLLSSGRLALWNPTILCGTPVWGNPQAFPLYPSSVLLWLMPAYQAVGVIAAFHVWLAAYGTFLFGRGRGLATGAALLGAIAWGMGGAMVSKAQFPNLIQAAAFLPWLLLCVDEAANKPRPLSAAKLGLTVGLALLAAHPQMFLMQFYLCAAWATFRLRTGTAQRRPAFLCLAAGLVLGLALAAGQLLPTIELVRDSVRTHLTMEQANRFVLPPYALMTNFVAPNFYGNPATRTEYVGRGNFWEPCAYVGLVPICLALWTSVRLFRKNREVRFWAIVALLGVWLALGRDGGLWAVAFWVVPGLSKFHDAARWLHIGTFALACLAAWGADAFLRAQANPIKRRIWAATLLALSAFDVVVFGRTLNPTTPASVWEKAMAARKPPLGKRAYFADESRAWAHWVSYRTYRNTQTDADVLQFLTSRTPNTGGLMGWDANGYEPVRRANTDVWLSILKKQNGVGKATGSAQNVGVTDVVRLGSTYSPQTRPVPGTLGRAIFASTGTAPVSLRVVDVSPQHVVVWLPPGEHAPGTVILADTLHPGWAARVDNRLVKIDQTRGVFRAVPVEKNEKRVDFVYEPASVREGVFISLGALGILTALTFSQRRHSRTVWGGRNKAASSAA